MMREIGAEQDPDVLDRLQRAALRRVGVRAAGRRGEADRSQGRESSRRPTTACSTSSSTSTTSRMRTARRFRLIASVELARRHVTVALSGDGGDEDFIGYRRYKLFAMEERVRSRLPLGAAPGGVRPARPLCIRSSTGRRACCAARRRSRRWRATRVDAYLHGVSICLRRDARRSCSRHRSSASCRAIGAREVFHGHVRGQDVHRPAGAGAVPRLQDLPARRHPDEGGPREHGAQPRSAHAVPRLRVRRVGGEPAERRQAARQRGQARAQAGARAACCRSEVLYRDKMGFAVPLDMWFRGSLRRSHRRRGARRAARGLAASSIRRCCRASSTDHQSGRRDYSASLWSLLMFDGFLQQADATHTVRRRRRARAPGRERRA